MDLGLLRRLMSATVELLLPPSCALCNGPPGDSGPTAFCGSCREGLSPGEPGARQQAPHPLRELLAWGDFDGGLQSLIRRFKYGPQRRLAAPLSGLLIERIAAQGPRRPYLALVPVPLHAERLRRRGFNQSWLLAGPVAENLAIPRRDALQRLRGGPAQATLDEAARRENVRDLFGLRPGFERQVQGDILLLDDVVTTGATAAECARVLIEAGASAVDLLALARTRAHDAR